MTVVDRPARAAAGVGATDATLAAVDLAARLAGPASSPAGGSVRLATVPSEEVDPIALFEAARELDLEAALWLQPADGLAIVGVGRAWSVEPSGPDRFALAADAWRGVLDRVPAAAGAATTGATRVETAGDARAGRTARPPRGAGPVLLGGLGFSGRVPPAGDPWVPFGAASLVLPALVHAGTPDGAFLTGAVGADADVGAGLDLARLWERLAARARELAPAAGAVVARPADAPLATAAEQPDRRAWDRLVGLFAGAVGRGRLDKVVLARRVVLRSPRELDPVNALRRMAAAGPESTTFAFVRGGVTFLGATPERLARTEGRAFRTVAIAGSAARGADREEDARLGAALLASDKEREEHAVVVDMLRDALAPLAERLEIANEPALLRLRHVQHLVTRIEGTLRDEAGLLALAGRLHPTPAVGGEPAAAALDLIAEHEGFERGWYAGPIGWLGADGDGEMMVALRCGLVAGQAATLFAGCGIVADSDPGREWEESRLKLLPVASALGRPDDGR